MKADPNATGRVETRLKELAIELPQPSKPGANYVPFVRSGNLLFLTGQLSQWNGERRFVGKLGREFGVTEGQQAARRGALNLLAHVREALGGDLDRVVRTIRLAGYVNSTSDFVAQSQVRTALDLFVELLGEAGRHARMAVGVSALPYDVAVEVEGIRGPVIPPHAGACGGPTHGRHPGGTAVGTVLARPGRGHDVVVLSRNPVAGPGARWPGMPKRSATGPARSTAPTW
jgi:enamine deaminase RidA (YjgF/YER057c/UK114 family)